MAEFNFTPEDEEVIKANPITDSLWAQLDAIFPHLHQQNHDVEDELAQYIARVETNDDAFHKLASFLSGLAFLKVARSIVVEGTALRIGTEINGFIYYWDKNRTLPQNTRRQLMEVLRLLLTGANELGIWHAISQLVLVWTNHSSHRQSTDKSSSQSLTSSTISVSEELRKHWSVPYFGDSLEALRDRIQAHEMEGFSDYYARSMVFVQSSGTGKSRLLDEFGQTCPMINFLISRQDTFPPPDTEVLDLLLCPLKEDHMNKLLESPQYKFRQSTQQLLESIQVMWAHGVAAGFLQAAFEIFDKWVEAQLSTSSDIKELAIKRHEEMAPVSSSSQPDTVATATRSVTRQLFCERVAKRALEIAESLVQDYEWREIFYEIHNSKARQKLSNKTGAMRSLYEAIQTLLSNLNKLNIVDGKQPLLAFALDEVSNLLSAESNANEGLYIALNRIISCLKEYPVWFFFLSTNSRIEDFVPSDEMQFSRSSGYRLSARKSFHQISSDSDSEQPLKRVPPFLALQLDIEDRRTMRENRSNELQKPIRDYADASHMARFGRPLWGAFTNSDELYKIARHKLVGEEKRYNSSNPNHVFAAMSFRLFLDACLQETVNIPLSRVAVNSFLRVIILLNQDSGALKTITPSEPILAKAAMELLCQRNHWPKSIQTLTGELLEKSSMEKGIKGELFIRLLLILAHDCVRFYYSPTKYPSTIRVGDFLQALYGAQYAKKLELIDSTILNSRLNFNHFISTDENLQKEHLHSLLRDLLRRQGALQLSPQQPQFDLLIPCHLGDEKYEQGHASVIAIQVKNRVKRSSPNVIFRDTFMDPASIPRKTRRATRPTAKDYILEGIVQPVLLLLLELDAPKRDGQRFNVKSSVSVSQASDQSRRMWLIESWGHDEETFECLKTMKCEKVIKPFFKSVSVDLSLHDQLAQRNSVFHKLDENYRYKPASTVKGDEPQVSDAGHEVSDGDEDQAEATGEGTSSSDESDVVPPLSSKRAKAGGRGDRKRARGEDLEGN